MHFLIECKITAIPATPQAHTLRKKILLLMIQNQEYNNELLSILSRISYSPHLSYSLQRNTPIGETKKKP